jgi:hypothetical protein
MLRNCPEMRRGGLRDKAQMQGVADAAYAKIDIIVPFLHIAHQNKG